MLSSVPIFPVYNFLDKIFGIQYLINFTFIIYLGTKWQYHQTRQAKALVVLLLFLTCPLFGDQLNGYSRKELQIFGCTACKSTNIYIFEIKISVCEKSYFEFFSWQWSHLSIPKISTFTEPPLHMFCPYLQDFWQISDADIFHWIFG